jgi:hypothetical protein
MADLPLNRLQCSDCKAFRSTTDFPFENGFRKPTCTKCKIQRANRRKVQVKCRRISVQKEAEKQEKEKEWRIKTNESAREFGNPLQCLDCWAYTCRCKQLQKGNKIGLQKTQREFSKEEQILADPPIRFCSSCAQERLSIQVGRFSTYDLCCSTNTKALRRRRENNKPRYRSPSLQQIEDHLQEWVAIDGEQELKLQKQNTPSLLLNDSRRP